MRPREFHNIAERLAANGKRPAEFRTAISRAYYAAYHVAREVLLPLGADLSGDRDAHVDVRMHLEHSGDRVLIEVSDALRKLHSDRKVADYNLTDATIEKQKEASARVERARMIMEKVEKQCLGSQKTQIATQIAQWVAAGKPRT